MTSHCPGNVSVCDTGWGDGATMQCGNPSTVGLPAPHHCRGWMVSDTDGETWFNPLNRSEQLFPAPVPDLPDPGCKGSVTRWTQGRALVSTNIQDGGDPGINQYPRQNLSVSLSLDNGRTWPHKRIIFPAARGWSTYSSVRVTSDQTIAVLFDTQQQNSCRTRVRNVTCTDQLSSVKSCIACALAHKTELTTPYPPANTRSYCPGDMGYENFDEDGGQSGVQPNPDNFIATVTSACSNFTDPASPDGMLFIRVDPRDVIDDVSSSSSPNHTTALLQHALNAAETVTIRPRPGAEPIWLVGLPLLFNRSHQVITFAPGTVVYAANNTFHGPTDALFQMGTFAGTNLTPAITNVTVSGFGAVWRMRRKDYAKLPSDKPNGWYTISEYRHGLSVQGVSNVTIEGITIKHTGGDGKSFITHTRH
eukprot:COSAG01_NODE_903_length_12848_cov_7.966899_7_plen_420_part_00